MIRADRMIRSAMQTAVQAIYPSACVGCGGPVGEDFALCGPCWRDTPFVGGVICELCGVPLMGEADDVAAHCDACMATPRPWSRGRAALVYEGAGRKLVMGLKHGDRHEIARAAGPWMARALRDVLSDDAVVVPVPLHRWRLLGRRFNQSALLAQRLAGVTGRDWCPDLLLRHRATATMRGKSGDERFAEVQDAFSVHPDRAEQAVNRQVVLVDDVMTSGATLGAATDALAASRPREVVVVTLARVAKEPYLRSN